MNAHVPKERTDASLTVVAATAGTLVLGIAASLLIGRLFLAAPEGRPEGPALGPDGLFRAGVASRTDIEIARAAAELEVRQHLDTYGWVDRQRGIVRIPIERAMEITAERGGRAP